MNCPYCNSEKVITSDRADKQDFCLECRREFEGEEEKHD